MRDDDITLYLDSTEIFTSDSKDADVKAIWNGNELKGLSKTVLIVVPLKKGKHSLTLDPHRNPHVKHVRILQMEEKDADTIRYLPADNNPPEKGDRRPESRVGYDNKAGINIMQVGNPGDSSLLTLRGELKEYWIHNGKTMLLHYDARVETVRDSIYWGVRWLYHKAQGITNNNKRYWIPWREAVVKYGPPKIEYANSVWDIYKKGIKKEKNGTIRLWSLILFMFMSLMFFDKSMAHSFKAQIKNEIIKNQQDILEDVEVTYNPADKNYFLAQIEWERDWWEDLRVGRIVNQNIIWFSIDTPPGEQAILSAEFIDVKGFSNPLVEVYGLTHAGHGNVYMYEIKNDSLNLLFEMVAVDFNPDTRWAPDNYTKYGHGTCGEIFSGGRLSSEYRDMNNDGISDILLRGKQEIICESEYGHRDEIHSGDVEVEQIFLWDKNIRAWSGGDLNRT